MPTLFVNDLTNIDCSILDSERGLIGASWAVDIELSGELDEQSMVFDFSKVKKIIKNVIDRDVDHKLLIPNNYSGLSKTQNEDLHLIFEDQSGNKIIHQSPNSAICEMNVSAINRQAIINYLNSRILAELPSNVEALNIELREEAATGNYFRYSHGLKKHDGNCQRIAHGHRSQIQIWQDGQRSNDLEKDIASRWHDIYLGSKEDIISETDERIQFAYTTQEGHFALELAKSRVHVLPYDSTVECIAEHLLDLIPSNTQSIKVKAFEGIGKGALASKN